MNREHLIDDVARALTATGEPVAMRARVLASIQSVGERRRHIARPIAVTIAASAAAAVLASALWRTTPVAPANLSGTTRLASTLQVPSGPIAPVNRGVGAFASQPVVPLFRVAPTVEEAAWLARAVPALAPPARLMVDEIQPSAVVMPLLDVAPLETSPLDLAPLSIEPMAGGG